MKLLYTHSNNPSNYIRIDIYNLVMGLDDPTDACLRSWAGSKPVQTMFKITRKYYETVPNTQQCCC